MAPRCWCEIPIRPANAREVLIWEAHALHRIRPGRAMKHSDTDRVVSALHKSFREPSAASLPPRNSLAIRRPRNHPRAAATSGDTNIIYFSAPVTHSAQLTYHAN